MNFDTSKTAGATVIVLCSYLIFASFCKRKTHYASVVFIDKNFHILQTYLPINIPSKPKRWWLLIRIKHTKVFLMIVLTYLTGVGDSTITSKTASAPGSMVKCGTCCINRGFKLIFLLTHSESASSQTDCLSTEKNHLANIFGKKFDNIQ